MPRFDNFFTREIVYPDPIDFHLYRKRDQWVFDDERVGLVAEPFVMGMDKIIDQLRAKVGIETEECVLWMRDGIMNEYGGFVIFLVHNQTLEHPLLGSSHWYRIETEGILGIQDERGFHKAWLCPNLHRYYAVAPKTLAFWITE